MIGDLGGFYGAIVIIPAFLMTIYSENMFYESLQAELPTKRVKTKDNPNKNDQLQLSI